MTISVVENSDGSLTIEWDENDPYESVFNTWTEEDFLNCLREHALRVINEYEPDSSEEWSAEDPT